MPEATVRQAVLADLDDLVFLFDEYRQFYGRPTDPDAARRFLRERFEHGQSTVFLAVSERDPVGFVQLYPSFSSVSLGRVFILNDLYVKPEARRSKAARMLLEAAVAYGKAMSAVRLVLSTAISNDTAQAVYDSAGWIRDEQFLHYTLPLV